MVFTPGASERAVREVFAFITSYLEILQMTIHDKHAFEDAQIMARAAIEMTERWWKEAYWYGAMQALKAAYKGK